MQRVLCVNLKSGYFLYGGKLYFAAPWGDWVGHFLIVDGKVVHPSSEVVSPFVIIDILTTQEEMDSHGITEQTLDGLRKKNPEKKESVEKKEMKPDDFTGNMRVEHIETKKIGTVQKSFPGTGSLYEPWEVPVIWDGDTIVHGVLASNPKSV